MTTVACFVDNEGIIAIGADSAITGHHQMRLSSPKIFQAGNLIIGFAGILPPVETLIKKRYSATERGVRSFAKDFKRLLTEEGHGASTEDGVRVQPSVCIVTAPSMGPYLVGTYGEVFSVGELYMAIGSGAEFALGTMSLAREYELGARETIESALRAAVNHDPFSDGPVFILEIEPKKTRPRSRKK